jgi:hypothetical protein
MILNDLEKAVLREISISTPEISRALDEQLEGIVVSSRENTNVGFYTTLRPKRVSALIKQPRTVGNVFAKIQGMQNPMTFVLFIKDGLVHVLEGASIEEDTSSIDFSTVKFEVVPATKHH